MFTLIFRATAKSIPHTWDAQRVEKSYKHFVVFHTLRHVCVCVGVCIMECAVNINYGLKDTTFMDRNTCPSACSLLLGLLDVGLHTIGSTSERQWS